MNAFQILDADGKAIPINELDRQAALHWGKEPDVKWYATPDKEGIASNWFDAIGWRIANMPQIASYGNTWKDVVSEMLRYSIIDAMFIKNETKEDKTITLVKLECSSHIIDDKPQIHFNDEVEERIMGTIQWANKYISLINYWIAQGYTPKQVIE